MSHRQNFGLPDLPGIPDLDRFAEQHPEQHPDQLPLADVLDD